LTSELVDAKIKEIEEMSFNELLAKSSPLDEEYCKQIKELLEGVEGVEGVEVTDDF
jgi:hypothetical protein